MSIRIDLAQVQARLEELCLDIEKPVLVSWIRKWRHEAGEHIAGFGSPTIRLECLGCDHPECPDCGERFVFEYDGRNAAFTEYEQAVASLKATQEFGADRLGARRPQGRRPWRTRVSVAAIHLAKSIAWVSFYCTDPETRESETERKTLNAATMSILSIMLADLLRNIEPKG